MNHELTLVYLVMEQGLIPDNAKEAKWCFENIGFSDFRDKTAQRLYATARSLFLDGQPWGHMDVRSRRSGEIGQAKANDEFRALLGSTPDHPPLPCHGIREIVKSWWKREDRTKAALALEEAAQAIDPIREHREMDRLEERTPFERPRRAASLWLDRLAELNNRQASGFRFGIEPLDEYFGGTVRPGELVVIGARPGVGKSALMIQAALSLYLRTGSWSMATLEMTPDSIVGRMACAFIDGPAEDIRVLSEGARDLAIEFAQRMDEAEEQQKIRFSTTVDTVSKLEAWVLQRETPDVLFVDYLQLMSDPRHAKNRTQEVSAISRDLKLMAGRLKIPVIVACQLNRLAESRTDRRPRLSDLRESGSIEQDADSVLLLHSPYRVWEEEKSGSSPPPQELLELTVAKNRRGDTGRVRLRYDKVTQRISPWAVRV